MLRVLNAIPEEWICILAGQEYGGSEVEGRKERAGKSGIVRL
jgi:hypothetical protein